MEMGKAEEGLPPAWVHGSGGGKRIHESTLERGGRIIPKTSQ